MYIPKWLTTPFGAWSRQIRMLIECDALLVRKRSHRRPNWLLLTRVEFSVGDVQVALPVHPIVQPGALEAPAVAQFEGGYKSHGGVFVESIGGDAEIVRGLTNVHDLAYLRDQQVGADIGAAHLYTPKAELSRRDSGNSAGNLVYNAVS